MLSPTQLAQLGCGTFFLTGLVTGIWKYRCMITSPSAQAPAYVDTCHRAALMYSFACLVLAEFARLSVWSAAINSIAVVVPMFFFATAVVTYAVHGFLRDTDNQLARPHVLGRKAIHGGVVSVCIYLLIGGELGGFLVLFAGFLKPLLGI